MLSANPNPHPNLHPYPNPNPNPNPNPSPNPNLARRPRCSVPSGRYCCSSSARTPYISPPYISLYLAYISPISRLGSSSARTPSPPPPSPLDLATISPPSPLDLACISPISRLHLRRYALASASISLYQAALETAVQCYCEERRGPQRSGLVRVRANPNPNPNPNP